MARRTFDLVDVIGILQHWHVGRSQREMSASLVLQPHLETSDSALVVEPAGAGLVAAPPV